MNSNVEDNDEYEIKKIIVDDGQAPMRIDKFLTNRLLQVTRSKVQNGIRDGLVTVNEDLVKSNYKIHPGDEITVMIPINAEYDGVVEPEDIPLEIYYEDSYLMVVNKPAGMVVHPGTGNYTGTLVNAIVFHLQNTDLPVLPGNDPDRPGLVHRIDKDTSGLLVIAKKENTLKHLAEQFHDHTVERKYQAIVWGEMGKEEGTINARIGRNPKNRTMYQTYPEEAIDSSKDAVTHFRVLHNYYYVSLIECVLETGRTHQIRVHMNAVGNTIFNDQKYGGDRILKGTMFSKYKQFVDNCFKMCPRQALHARSLGFIHPETGKKMFFEAPLPEDMASILDKWRNYVKDRIEK